MFANSRIPEVLARIFRQRSLFVLVVLFLGDNLQAWQTLSSQRPWSSNVIVPQCYRNGSYSSYADSRTSGEPKSRLQISQIDVDIDIRDQTSSTTLLIAIHNGSSVDQTAELVIPVPKGAVVRGFTFSGANEKPSTELLESDSAKQIFQDIVSKLRDPALLEFAGYNLVRSSVFPVPAGGDQKIHLILEQLLPSENQRIDYVLPRSQSLSGDVPWNISARVRSASTIATLYSPSHQIAVQRISDSESKLSVPKQKTEPGAFRLSYLNSNGPLSASLMTSPEVNGKSGHFLLLAGLADQAEAKQPKEKIRREITLVIDRSGSMSGEKIEQAKQAAVQVISSMDSGEAFNIVCFSSIVEQFSKQPTIKSTESALRAIEFIQTITPTDGTNIHDALVTSLAPAVSEGCLPIVLFLTDGLPTVGNMSETAIREVAEKQNPHKRRIFTFGVGFDVNTPLLDKLAVSTRGFATFVTPGENVEVAVSKVFRGLNGPTLSDVELRIADQDDTQPQRIYDVLPGRLPDLYEGDQLVVLGSYRGDQPLKFVVTAKRGDKPLRFNFEFEPKEIKGQPFVSRLWASRKIASLIDQVRDMGAQGSESASQVLVANQSASSAISNNVNQPSATKVDPRLAELTDSIIALSKKYGVLTEYTSFLATEGVDLSDAQKIKQALGENLVSRALNCRTGQGSWNQEINNGVLRGQNSLNLGNRYVDQTGNWVSTTTIAQCRGNALYNRSGRWIEANLISKTDVQPDQKVEFGSPEFMQLMWQLVELGRQDELSVEGEIMITVEGNVVLVHGTQPTSETQPASEK